MDVAVDLADREGPPAVTLARVAAELGVRTPSLYHHVDGLQGLRRAMALRALQQLDRQLQRAAVGRADAEAVRQLALAYREFAQQRPGLYAATLATPEGDADIRAAGEAVVATVVAALAGYGFDEATAVHATRSLRSALHGFVSLELAGSFAMAVDPDETFSWLVEALIRGLADLAGEARL